MAKSSRREKGAGKEGGTGQRRGVDRTRRTGKEGKGDGTEWAGEGKIRWLQFCRRQYGCIFIRVAVAVSQICEITANFPKTRTYSSSRLNKFIDLGANRNRIRLCNILLVVRLNSFRKFGYRHFYACPPLTVIIYCRVT